MAGLPKGNSDPTPGGLAVGYTLNKSEQAECPISVDVANVLYGEEKRAKASTERGKRRGPSVYLYDEHMGPERLG